MGRKKKIAIEKLCNNTGNPRHLLGNSEKDTLKKLFDSVGIRQMVNLAEDVQKNGLLNNQEIVVVSSLDNEKYVIYDGNRRVAAIKLLINPKYFDFIDRQTINRIEKLHVDPEKFSTLDCYVTDIQEAEFIMERIHSGEDKGRGTKNWNAREKENFKVRRSGNESMPYLIDLYSRKYFDEFDITTILPYTTIDRIFNNREIKEKIGLDKKDISTFTKDSIDLVIESAKWIRNEAESNGESVTRMFNKRRAIEDALLPWIDSYNTEVKQKSKTEHSFEKNKEIDDTSRKGDARQGEKENVESKNNYSAYKPRNKKVRQLLFTDVDGRIINRVGSDSDLGKKINSIVFELANMDIERTPYAVTCLYRALIESATKYCSMNNSIGFHENSLEQSVNAIIKFFLNNAGKKKKYDEKDTRACLDIVAKRKMISLLNNYIHNEREPDIFLLEDSWKTMKHYIVMCLI